MAPLFANLPALLGEHTVTTEAVGRPGTHFHPAGRHAATQRAVPLQPRPTRSRPYSHNHALLVPLLQGFCVYHCNRLVKPWWKVYSSSSGDAHPRAAWHSSRWLAPGAAAALLVVPPTGVPCLMKSVFAGPAALSHDTVVPIFNIALPSQVEAIKHNLCCLVQWGAAWLATLRWTFLSPRPPGTTSGPRTSWANLR